MNRNRQLGPRAPRGNRRIKSPEFWADDGLTFHNPTKERVADKDEAAGAADATAWVSPEISGAADIVWVIGKGDSCDPFTQDD
ncbi:MAG: hypothetical protein WBF04_07665, partial [Candidatus Sulfotelmatobacter sp.]